MIEKIYEVPPYMDVVLANAVYFKACWKKPFKIENTKSWKFKNFNSSEGDVMMMLVSDQGTTIPYAEIEGTEMVTLPFSAGNFVMDLILPSKTEDFRNLTQRLSDGFFGDLLNGQQERKKEAIDLSVRFPRFEINGDMSLAKLVLSQLNILHWNFPE